MNFFKRNHRVPNNAAHFSQCSLLYSWLQRVLQPLWKAWMGSSRRSAEARGRRLERERARRRQRLASETAAERERRLSQRRARDRARRAARSSPTSETRLVQMGSVERRRRATETPDQRETRLVIKLYICVYNMYMYYYLPMNTCSCSMTFPSLRIVQADKQILPQ